MSEWTVNGVVMDFSVASRPARLPLITDQAVGAWRVHAIAIRRGRLRPDEVVALFDRKDEKRVVPGDAVGRQTGEEFSERVVVAF